MDLLELPIPTQGHTSLCRMQGKNPWLLDNESFEVVNFVFCFIMSVSTQMNISNWFKLLFEMYYTRNGRKNWLASKKQKYSPQTYHSRQQLRIKTVVLFRKNLFRPFFVFLSQLFYFNFLILFRCFWKHHLQQLVTNQLFL